jgi:hypothetical protein
MGIALFTAARLLAPVHKLLRECVAMAERRFIPESGFKAQPLPQQATRTGGAWPPVCGGAAAKDALRRPLRVVRVLDGQQGHRSSGRMVISGRMADVCAELDRLVACEGRSA